MSLVTLLTPDDLQWPMGVQDSVPQYALGGGSYARTFKVDPYPAYPHDLQRAEAILQHCMEMFPLKVAKFGVYLLSHDFIDRVNGITYEDWVYNREDGSEWEDEIPHYDGSGEKRKFRGQAITIALAGKRIPIMPAMTRYLVSHEYGHAVFNYVARMMGYKDHEKDKLEQKYMEMRGVESYEKKYKGGKWHAAPGEIIANDFRLLFTKQETEFWPHDCRPSSWFDSGIAQFWLKALKICGLAEKAANIESFIHGTKKEPI